MKVRFNRWYNAVLSTLLTMLGFGACSDSVVEYGTPNADFQIKGQVTYEGGIPIPGIRVRAPYSYIDGENNGGEFHGVSRISLPSSACRGADPLLLDDDGLQYV